MWPQICRIPTQITKPRWCKINNLQGSQQLYFVLRWISTVGKLIQVRWDLFDQTVKFINTHDLEYRSGCGSSLQPPAPQTSVLPTRLTLPRPNFKLYTHRSIQFKIDSSLQWQPKSNFLSTRQVKIGLAKGNTKGFFVQGNLSWLSLIWVHSCRQESLTFFSLF